MNLYREVAGARAQHRKLWLFLQPQVRNWDNVSTLLMNPNFKTLKSEEASARGASGRL